MRHLVNVVSMGTDEKFLAPQIIPKIPSISPVTTTVLPNTSRKSTNFLVTVLTSTYIYTNNIYTAFRIHNTVTNCLSDEISETRASRVCRCRTFQIQDKQINGTLNVRRHFYIVRAISSWPWGLIRKINM